jgi:hypothetical protein
MSSCFPESEDDSAQRDPRGELQAYLSALDEHLAAQIDDIESLVSSERVHGLRDGHHDWIRGRDVYCWEVGRNSPNDLVELECLLALSGDYFDQREAEISQLAETPGDPAPED